MPMDPDESHFSHKVWELAYTGGNDFRFLESITIGAKRLAGKTEWVQPASPLRLVGAKRELAR